MREDFPESSDHCEYIKLDINDPESLDNVRDMIKSRHDTLDILINNAGRYEVPDISSPAKFGDQADLIVGTNYWGLKNVVKSMRDIFTPG